MTRLWTRKEMLLRVLALAAALALLATLWLLRGSIADLKPLGYPGVFLISLLSSASIFLPVPGLLSVCGISLVLNPIVIGLLAGIGETLGELTGYAVGYGGQGAIARHKLYARAHDWMERRGTVVLFAVSMIPNPIFDVVGVAAGAARFPLVRFMVTVWAGKSLKNVMVAYTCFYGVKLLPWVG